MHQDRIRASSAMFPSGQIMFRHRITAMIAYHGSDDYRDINLSAPRRSF
jgi:hypothetical protein